MTTEWAYLPNATHIDAVLAHVKAHPKKWVESRNATCRDASWISARRAARNKAWHAIRGDALTKTLEAALNKAWDASQYNSMDTSRDAILTLVAYDDCAYLLDSTPDELRVIIALSGNTKPAAVLLLPAVIAFHKELVPA